MSRESIIAPELECAGAGSVTVVEAPKENRVTYSSPKAAAALQKVFGDKASQVKVAVRASKDVPKFLARVAAARVKSARSTLRFK